MTEFNKPKLQLRSSLSVNGDKSPSPATKLLINHGKPNFTIQRPPKIPNGILKSTSPTPTPAATCNIQNNNNNESVIKSTTFNGVFKPSNISAATKQVLPQNANTLTKNAGDNEAAKVVLRRTIVPQTEMRESEDNDNIPEFIRRQRRIQERLANQNILDFENRRSGYFTQVMISPSNPNRKSFAETMASPAVKPGLEIPPPSTMQQKNIISDETTSKEQESEHAQQNQQSDVKKSQENVSAEAVPLNAQVEEEEVAKAIEEVNKAVEGEDDDKAEQELENFQNNQQQETEQHNCSKITLMLEEEIEPKKDDKAKEETTETEEITFAREVTVPMSTFSSSAQEIKLQTLSKNLEGPKSNGLAEEKHSEYGILKATKLDNEIIICHANGMNGPSIPAPDPKGEKGVNFEPKTVVSFSQELGNGENKYPDTVKVAKIIETSEADSELKELTKLKFEIKADNENIEVKPVLINETV